MLNKRFVFLFLYLIKFACFSQEFDTSKIIEEIEQVLIYNRAKACDLSIKPAWIPLHCLPIVKSVLENPLENIKTINVSVIEIKSSQKTSEVIKKAITWLDIEISDELPKKKKEVCFKKNIPKELDEILSEMMFTIEESQRSLEDVVNSLTKKCRENIIEIVSEITKPDYALKTDFEELGNLTINGWKRGLFQQMERFNLTGLCKAFYNLACMCDRYIPKLKKLKEEMRLSEKISSHCKRVIIGGIGDNEYDEKEIKDAVLIIDLGGNNAYKGPVASAKESEVKVVIDFGRNVEIMCNESCAGSGVFGCGLLYLPNPTGKKIIKVGDNSAGCGIFGCGGLFIEGEAEITSNSFSQGSGCFGIGILLHKNADNSRYIADFFSQGVGTTKGVGILYIQGDNTELESGLVIPDFREEFGFTSLSQGIGYGPRAFAGGGVGIFIHEGNNSKITSSYFAQGCGYYFGLGIFYKVGRNSKIKARRYSQGSGVHQAFGIATLIGENNEFINWGVGPAYGWDSSIGIFIAEGDKNSFYADWGCCHGEINGRGIFYISGDSNTILLPELGTGSFLETTPSYAISIINGKNTILRSEPKRGFTAIDRYFFSKLDPWGVLKVEEFSLSKEELPRISWKKQEKTKRLKEPIIIDKTKLRLYESYLKNGDIKNLLNIPIEDIDILFELYTPYCINEIIILRTVLASYGKFLYPHIIKKLENSTMIEKSLYVDLLKFCPVDVSVPTLLSLLKDEDWRIRLKALDVLGYLFNHDLGSTPGRVSLLDKTLQFLKKQKMQKIDEIRMCLNEKNLSDVLGFFSLSKDFNSEDKQKFYEISPDIFSYITEELKKYFCDFLFRNRDTYIFLITEEIKKTKRVKNQIKKEVFKTLEDKEDSVKIQAINTLGKLQAKEYIKTLKKFIYSENTRLKEVTIASLAKLGNKSINLLKKEFKKADEKTKMLIVVAPFHSWEKETIDLIRLGLNDNSKIVQMTAKSTLLNLKPPLSMYAKKLTIIK